MSEITWTVSTPDGVVTRTGANKMPYIMPIKITKEMDDSQKTFFTKYNEMQKTLIDNGLMETK